MKKFLFGGMLAAFLSPALVFAAAYNDVTVSAATLSVNGISMAVSAGTIVSSAVGASSFDITLAPGSTAHVIATGRNQMAITSGTGFVTDTRCNDTDSYFTLAADANAATTTVTVTPSSTLCSSRTSTGGSGEVIAGATGGGGGGGGYVAPAVNTVAQTAPVPTTTGTSLLESLQAQLAGLLAQIATLQGGVSLGGSTPFKRDMQMGSTGDDVKSLQVYLNTHGFLVSSSGPGSLGNETTRFGGATRSALIKLQKAAGITPAAGYLGAKTRAYIAAHQ